MRLIYILLIFFFIHSCSNPKKDVVSILPTSVSNFDDFGYADSLLNQYYISYINREIVTENIVQAIKHFERSLEYNSIDSAYIILNKLAECNMILGDYQKSLEYLNSSLMIDNNNYNTHFLRARIYQSLDLNEQCINLCDSLLSSDTIPVRNIIENNLVIADMYRDKYNPLSIIYYDNILALNPNNIEALYGKGMFYQNEANYGEAQDMYFKIRDLDPLHLGATFNLGYTYIESGNFRYAINYFSDVIVSEPQYYKAFYSRARCYEKLGDVRRAEEDYRKVLEIYNYLDTEERLNRILEDNKKYN